MVAMIGECSRSGERAGAKTKTRCNSLIFLVGYKSAVLLCSTFNERCDLFCSVGAIPLRQNEREYQMKLITDLQRLRANLGLLLRAAAKSQDAERASRLLEAAAVVEHRMADEIAKVMPDHETCEALYSARSAIAKATGGAS